MAKRSLWATPQITFTCLIPRMTQHENSKSLLQKREGKRQVVKMPSFHVLWFFLTCITQEIPSVVFPFYLKIMLLVIDWGVASGWSQKWCIFNTYLFMYLLTMFCHCGFLSHLLSLSEMRRHLPEPWLIRPARVEVTHSVFCYFACHENHSPWNQLLILLGRSYNFLTDRREYKMFRSRRWTTVPEQCLNFQKSSSC